MFPLRDENPTRTAPVLTILLVAVNVAVFLWQMSTGLNTSILELGLIPAELVHGADRLYRGRPLPSGVTVENLNPAWMTLFSSMFMHGGWLHLLGNMWFLWIFGNNVEDAMGRPRFLAFYLLAGLAAAGAQIVMGTDSPIPMVGASGAIGGVLGAYLVLFPGSRVITLITAVIITTVELPAIILLGYWFVLQLVQGLMSQNQVGGVAYAAHVGGFVFGMLAGRLLGRAHPPPRRHRRAPDFMDYR